MKLMLYRLYLTFICWWNELLEVYSRTYFSYVHKNSFEINSMKIEVQGPYDLGYCFVILDEDESTVYFSVFGDKFTTNLKKAIPPRGLKIRDNYYTTKEQDIQKSFNFVYEE